MGPAPQLGVAGRATTGWQRSGLLALVWPVSSLGDPELEQWVDECAAEWSAVFSQQRCFALECLDGSLYGVLGLAVA